MLLPRLRRWAVPFALLLSSIARCSAYQVLVSEQDECVVVLSPHLPRRASLISLPTHRVRQVCSGMWTQGEQEPFIEGALHQLRFTS
jgi:hypothetical protein